VLAAIVVFMLLAQIPPVRRLFMRRRAGAPHAAGGTT
jgi:hypothetical protein